jgi:hypothetical protein
MATLFNGWGVSWGSAWGPIDSDPGAMRGAASFSITAAITVNAGEMVGAAHFAIVAGLDNRVKTGDTGSGGADLEDEVDEYREEVEKIIKNAQRRRVEEEEVLAAIINFVLEQA